MINLQIQIFLLLAVGYLIGKLGWMAPKTRDQLTDIVIYIILPCTVVSSFQTELTKDVLASTGQVLISAFVMQIIYGILNLFLYRWLPKDEQISCKYGTMVTNASFVGLPIVSSVYGATGLLYASIFIIPQRFFMWAYGLPLYTQVEKKDIARKILTHPCIIAIPIGILVMILYSNGIFLPAAITKTLSSLGGCTTALCMMIIGTILSELKLREMFSLHALWFSFCRLLLIPCLMILLLKLTPFSLLAKEVCVLMSAMPSPTTVVILAQKYNRNPAFSSKVMVTSTLLSLVTIPIVLKLCELI